MFLQRFIKAISNFIWWPFYFSFLSIFGTTYYDNKNSLIYAQQQSINAKQNGAEKTDFNPLENPLLNPVRKYAATFSLPDRHDNIAYVWGGEGKHSTGAFRDIVPYFNSIQINTSRDVTFQNVTYNFVNNSRNYKNFATAASAVVDPHNSNRVLFFGGFRASLFGTSENVPLYVEQYDFSNSQWASIIPTVALPSLNTSTNGTIAPPRNRAYFSAIAAQGNIYIAGGIGTDSNRTVDPVGIWMYDSVNQVFSPAVQGNIFIGGGPYESVDGFILRDGRILYITGVNRYIFIFDPNTNSLTRQEVGYSDPNLPQNSTITQGLAVFTGNRVTYHGGFHYTVNSSQRRDVGYTEPRDAYQLVFTNISSRGNEPNTTITAGENTEWSWTTIKRDDSLQEYQESRYGASVIVNKTSYTIWRMFGCGEARCHNTFAAYEFGDFGINERPRGNRPTTNITIPAVVVGVVVILLIIFGLIIWRYRRNKLKKALGNRMTKVFNSVKAFMFPVYSFILWNPRPGEPRWAESLHMITKIILFCVFCAYLTYSINQVVTSPTSILSIQQQNETVPTPDVRLCVRGLTSVNVSCTTANIRGCPNEGPLQFTNSRSYPNSTYKPARLGTECWYSQGGGILEYGDTLQFQLQYEIDDAAGDHSLQIEVYPQRSANPNVYLYYTPEQQNAYFFPNMIGPTQPDEQSLISWAMQDVQYDGPTLNRYTIDLTMQNRPVIAYQHETHQSLSSSPWNVFGFASSYDEDLEITTTFQTGSITPRINSTAGGTSSSTIVLWPSQMADITLQEQRVYSLVTVLGSVGGLLALLITINGFLYGRRPNSPWGVVHNFFGFKTSLQQNLYNKFGFMGRPIPLVHPVGPHLFDNSEDYNEDWIQKYDYFQRTVGQESFGTLHPLGTKNSSNTAIHQPNYNDDIDIAKNTASTPSSSSSATSRDDDDPRQLELELVNARLESYARSHKGLQRRIQFLEVMLKSYYINDEVMMGLNSAYENEKVNKFIMGNDNDNNLAIDMDPSRLHDSTMQFRFTSTLQKPFRRHRQEENTDNNYRSKNNTSPSATTTASNNNDNSSEDVPFIKDQ